MVGALVARYGIPLLLQTPAAVRFACEPLLEGLELQKLGLNRHFSDCTCLDCRGGRKLCYLDWLIVGGESGPKARPIDPDWVRSLRDQCQQADIPFFFKQWGGRTPKANGRLLDGVGWSEFPAARMKARAS